MTERLSQLLHDEATDLDLPAPDPHRILSEGRRLRRRHRIATGVVAAALAVVGGSTLLALGDRGERDPQPVGGARDAIVWGYGDRVHLDDVAADVPGTVLLLRHTSVGVLAVSTTEEGELAGPTRLTLVRHDGTTEDLGELEAGSEPVTDPDRDLYVVAERRGADRAVVVRDAQTGELRDELAVPGLGAARPSMALDGDTLYVRAQPRRILTVDLATGEVGQAPTNATYYSDATRERVVTGDRRTFRVVDVGTGEELMRFPTGDGLVRAELSPDARFLSVVRGTPGPGVGYQHEESWRVEVYDVATGELVPDIDIGDADATLGGWTLSGDLYALTDTGVIRCEVPAGGCTETAIDALPDLPEPDIGDQPLAQIVLPG